MSKAVILLVEDNERITQANRRMLEMNGYSVDTAADLRGARAKLERELPDLIVLDILLPDGSGLNFCREVHQSAPGIPVLMLSALGKNHDIVTGLRAGGDDYLTKPYDYAVLLARIEALLRRSAQTMEASMTRKIGPFELDLAAQRAYRGEEDLMLKPREFALFKLLAENPGVFYPPEELFERIWASDPNGDVRTLYSHISRLRGKLGSDEGFSIEQKRGKGYRLVLKER